VAVGLSATASALRGCRRKELIMSNTMPVAPRAPLQPHQLFAVAWAQPAAPATPSGLRAFLIAWRRCVRDALAGWRDRRQIHATRVALMHLDDQTLRDIGFVRAEIESVAAEAHGGMAATRDRLLARVGPPAH
jgi:uncharacterized protein YjiS (DUF1127 family)